MRGDTEALYLEGDGADALTVRRRILRQAGIAKQARESKSIKPVKFYVLSQKEYSGKRWIDILLSAMGLLVLILL